MKREKLTTDQRHHDAKVDVSRANLARLKDHFTKCCETNAMIHPVLGCYEVRALLSKIEDLESQKRELIGTLEALDGERRQLMEEEG